MNQVHALVVGIDHYDQEDWSIDGPCLNALAVVDCLLRTQIVPPENITLFVDTRGSEHDTAIQDLHSRGVKVHRRADHASIEEFWSVTLREQQSPNSRLFVYWSGHGYADAHGDRIFICRDYRHPALPRRIFNCTNVLRHLHSSDFQAFSEQLLLADVCAVKANVKISPDTTAPSAHVPNTLHLTLYATPEGKYAQGTDGCGVFTSTVLTVLERLEEWPSLRDFNAATEVAFNSIDKAIFSVARFDNEREDTLRVGTLPENTQDIVLTSVLELIGNLGVPEPVIRQHFMRTASDLGEPSLAAAQGLTGMVQELLALRDAFLPGQVPHGLLVFLKRLQRQDAALSAPIQAWLLQHAGNQRTDLETIQHDLDEEAATMTAIVEVNDEEERIASYDLSLRTHSLAPVPAVTTIHRDITDWADFAAKLIEDIDSLPKHCHITHLQFLVNPPLFDRKFHAIQLTNGDFLGEECVVLLRHKDRVRSRSPVLIKAWRRYADAVRPLPPAQLDLVPVDSGTRGAPTRPGLCYASFVVPSSTGGSPAGRIEKETLRQLLKTGVAYLYWLHELQPECTPEGIKQRFNEWLRSVASLDQFPLHFSEHRSSGDPYACEATLLWDDPLFNPFRHTQGVQRE